MNCTLDSFKPYQRTKLSDALSRCETIGDRSTKPKTLRRVRCSDWLDGNFMTNQKMETRSDAQRSQRSPWS